MLDFLKWSNEKEKREKERFKELAKSAIQVE